ncbi:MAG: CDP-alcohol phosphatidyltransferase family protein [Arenicellales bacterium]
MITTIPNIITMFRIATVPVLILLLHDQQYGWAFLVFLVSGISDGLDGFIAKRFDMASELGAILDPLADKALIFSSYLMLMLLGDLPFWLFLTVIFRDVLILAGSLIYVAFNGQVKMAPSYLSKLNTFMQIALVVNILAQKTFGLDYPSFTNYLIYATFITTILSGVHYVWVWVVKEEIEMVDNVNDDPNIPKDSRRD